MTDQTDHTDLISQSDKFRLSIDPTPDDVNWANWLIDRMTATIVQQADRIAELERALDECVDWLEVEFEGDEGMQGHMDVLNNARAVLKQEDAADDT